MSSGWLSGQPMVTMNSALVSILPWSASGFMTRSAMKNRNATTCSALNSMTLKGSNGLSSGQLPKLSMRTPFEHGHHENLGQVGGKAEQPLGRLVEHVILGLHQDRADQPGQGRVHGHRHAVAH